MTIGIEIVEIYLCVIFILISIQWHQLLNLFKSGFLIRVKRKLS